MTPTIKGSFPLRSKTITATSTLQQKKLDSESVCRNLENDWEFRASGNNRGREQRTDSCGSVPNHESQELGNNFH